jgi:hypothetical protein
VIDGTCFVSRRMKYSHNGLNPFIGSMEYERTRAIFDELARIAKENKVSIVTGTQIDKFFEGGFPVDSLSELRARAPKQTGDIFVIDHINLLSKDLKDANSNSM